HPTTKLVGAFVQLPDRRFAATRTELTDLGIKVPGSGDPGQQIVIDDLAGVSYRYDEPSQQIFLDVGDEQRVTRTYDARASSGAMLPVQADYGAVMNYT